MICPRLGKGDMCACRTSWPPGETASVDENEYLDLPDDPEEAFAILHAREYERLEGYWEENRDSGNFHSRRYVDKLLAFDEVYNLGILDAFRNPPSHSSDFSDFFQDFRRHAEITSQKILMEAARRHKTGAEPIVVLDDAARTALHHFIGQIREKLNELALPEEKREALFNKLNAFAAEVDRNRTRTAAFLAFTVDVTHASKDMIEPFKPLQRTVDRVLDVLDKATKWRDALPPWSERKKIEGPPKKLPPPSPSGGLDDEIPF